MKEMKETCEGCVYGLPDCGATACFKKDPYSSVSMPPGSEACEHFKPSLECRLTIALETIMRGKGLGPRLIG